jgi:HNH endonuclease
MARRSKRANVLVEWVGEDSIRLINADRGWPSHYRARSVSEWVDVAIYFGWIGDSKRGRSDVERRFQNPGKNRPILEYAGELLLLLGLYESDSTRLLVGMEVQKRIGKTTRQSLFVPLHLLRTAGAWGWAEHFSDSGERLIAFQPQLLPIYIESCRAGVDLAAADVERIVVAAGASDVDSEPQAAARAIATIGRLVRDAIFSRSVRDAYDGRCAMCGLYPVAAPGSEDEVWNGLALCRNHHAAFDAHLVYIEPTSARVSLHPDLLIDTSAGCKAFVGATFSELALPGKQSLRPRREMFERRYDFFRPKYDWA